MQNVLETKIFAQIVICLSSGETKLICLFVVADRDTCKLKSKANATYVISSATSVKKQVANVQFVINSSREEI